MDGFVKDFDGNGSESFVSLDIETFELKSRFDKYEIYKFAYSATPEELKKFIEKDSSILVGNEKYNLYVINKLSADEDISFTKDVEALYLRGIWKDSEW